MSRPAFTDSYLTSLRTRTDPKADDVVADFVREQGDTDPRFLVRELIAHRRSLPPERQIPSVRAYFDEPVALPTWAEPDVLRRGRAFFNIYGVHIASALFSASLPMSYTSVDGTQVLMRTAELVSNTRRRLAQTGEMLLDVMGANDDDGSAPFAFDAPSYRAPHGVRLFHAAVRHMLRADAHYDVGQFGEPINQEDLLGTLLCFTVVVVDALERFGVALDPDDRDAYLRLWLTAGFLLGIEPELLCSRRNHGDVPLAYEEMCELRTLIIQRQAGESDAGRILMRALIAEQQTSLPFVLRGMPSAMTRALIGATYSDYLAVPPARVAALLLRPLPLVNRLLFGRVYYDLSGWLSAKIARSMYRAWIGRSAASAPNPWRYGSVVGPWKLTPATTRARRVCKHPTRALRERKEAGTAFAMR
jgi:hypothetical protein